MRMHRRRRLVRWWPARGRCRRRCVWPDIRLHN
jgi:hypothetical protein